MFAAYFYGENGDDTIEIFGPMVSGGDYEYLEAAKNIHGGEGNDVIFIENPVIVDKHDINGGNGTDMIIVKEDGESSPSGSYRRNYGGNGDDFICNDNYGTLYNWGYYGELDCAEAYVDITGSMEVSGMSFADANYYDNDYYDNELVFVSAIAASAGVRASAVSVSMAELSASVVVTYVIASYSTRTSDVIADLSGLTTAEFDAALATAAAANGAEAAFASVTTESIVEPVRDD